jgi:hypothetical protein
MRGAQPDKNVLIYSTGFPGLLDIGLRAAREAEWRPSAYDDYRLAVEELDRSFGALIASIGAPTAGYDFAYTSLLDQSAELSIPTAIVSNNPAFAKYGRSSHDIYLPREGETTVSRLGEWLLGLSVQD